jgi:hypothetical protein
MPALLPNVRDFFVVSFWFLFGFFPLRINVASRRPRRLAAPRIVPSIGNHTATAPIIALHTA